MLMASKPANSSHTKSEAWTILTISIGLGLALMFYEALLRVFSR